AERFVQADWMARYDAEGLRLFGRHAENGGDLFHGRLAALLDRQFAAHALDGRPSADLMAGHANGASGIRQGAGDALANPPGRVGAELVPQAMLVLVHGPHEAAIAFLNEIRERQAATAIALGDRHNQAQVALGQFSARLLILDPAMLQHTNQLGEIVGGRTYFESKVAQLFGSLGTALAIGQ